jgi:uncharacterized membrane protein YhaH (DUF805 family)
MPHSKYKIVFKGELMPDSVLDEVKDKLALLFKSDRSKINALFDGRPIALKRDLSADEAEKYLAALQRTGAKVYKEADLAAGLSLVATDDHDAAPAAAVEAVDSSQMNCPKCAHQQAKAPMCEACGIVIDKFLAGQAELAATQPATPASATSSTPTSVSSQIRSTPYATPTSNVAEVLPEFAELQLFGVTGRLGRLRYLAWSLAVTASALIAAGLAFGVSAALGMSGGTSLLTIIGGLLGSVVIVAMMVFGIQIGVKRLHDIGWSGWLLLLNLVPVVGSVFSIILLVVPGGAGANRFGPPPPPNSLGVKVLASLWLLVPILLAAIAIPAYQDYVERARDAQGSSYEQTERADYAADPVEAAAPFADYTEQGTESTDENQ